MFYECFEWFEWIHWNTTKDLCICSSWGRGSSEIENSSSCHLAEYKFRAYAFYATLLVYGIYFCKSSLASQWPDFKILSNKELHVHIISYWARAKLIGGDKGTRFKNKLEHDRFQDGAECSNTTETFISSARFPQFCPPPLFSKISSSYVTTPSHFADVIFE